MTTDISKPDPTVTARRMWASVDQAAGHFRVSKRTIEKLLNIGAIRGVRLGRCLRVDLLEIEQHLAELRRGPAL